MLQLLEWAESYVSGGLSSEEEAQQWLQGCLANPDPPGFVAETYDQQDASQALQSDQTHQASNLKEPKKLHITQG